jgi:hypothetical protein
MVTSIKGNDTSTFGGNIDVTGNVVTDAPAFSAVLSSSQTVSVATFTKIQFDTEDFDTNSNYDTSLYRFTPTVAGYYLFTTGVYTYLSDRLILGVYKNGSIGRWIADTENTTNGFQRIGGSTLLYANGTTDYFESFVYMTSSTSVTQDTASFFQAHLVRAV